MSRRASHKAMSAMFGTLYADSFFPEFAGSNEEDEEAKEDEEDE